VTTNQAQAFRVKLSPTSPTRAHGARCAWEKCPPKPPPVKKCNSGRGNGSEGSSSQLIIPGTGSAGMFPTVDCDPGNSGANRGGD
jgi:hypothetical protein